ncbi:MAG: mobile mystery protein B, partial [bacterium]
VWRWAGQFRTTDRNIGVEPWNIRPQLRVLLDDARYWVEHDTYSPDEIAVRFHHRLVWIHPFPNGNGRHARLMADLFAEQHGRPRFTWGSSNLAAQGAVRQQYIAALQQADQQNVEPLLQFARS